MVGVSGNQRGSGAPKAPRVGISGWEPVSADRRGQGDTEAVGWATWGEELSRGQQEAGTDSQPLPPLRQPPMVQPDQSKGGMWGPVPPLQVSPP